MLGLCLPCSQHWGLALFLLGLTRTCVQISAPLCSAPARVCSEEEEETEFNDVGEFGTALAWRGPDEYNLLAGPG